MSRARNKYRACLFKALKRLFENKFVWYMSSDVIGVLSNAQPVTLTVRDTRHNHTLIGYSPHESIFKQTF